LSLAARHEAYCVSANKGLDAIAARALIIQLLRSLHPERPTSTPSIAKRTAFVKSAISTASPTWNMFEAEFAKFCRAEVASSRSHCVHQTDDAASEHPRKGIAWRGSASGAAVTDAGRNNPSPTQPLRRS
jgi:hypothetical protein